jgi:hypothetical protein
MGTILHIKSPKVEKHVSNVSINFYPETRQSSIIPGHLITSRPFLLSVFCHFGFLLPCSHKIAER